MEDVGPTYDPKLWITIAYALSLQLLSAAYIYGMYDYLYIVHGKPRSVNPSSLQR